MAFQAYEAYGANGAWEKGDKSVWNSAEPGEKGEVTGEKRMNVIAGHDRTNGQKVVALQRLDRQRSLKFLALQVLVVIHA